MFLELIFSDAGSVRDYLERRSIADLMTNSVIWHEMFMSRMVGFNRSPFIWYDYNGNYHLDIQVKELKDAYDFLPRYKWDDFNDGIIVHWGSCPYSHGVQIYRFYENWLWSREMLLELIEDKDKLAIPITNIHNVIYVDVYQARKIREYTPVRPRTRLPLFELSFKSCAYLEKWLCYHEKNSQIDIVKYADFDHGCYREYPLVIRHEPIFYNDTVKYTIDVYTANKRDLHAYWYGAEIREVDEQGLFDGKMSPKWFVKTDAYGFFNAHVGRYKWRTYKPDWTPEDFKEKYDHLFESIASNFGIPKGCTKGMFDKAKDAIYEYYMKKDFGKTEESNNSYMLCARGNGKSFRQLKEALEQYMSTGNPIVAVDRKVDVYNKEKLDRFLQPKPILRFDDLDEKTLKYIDTDVTACVEYYSNKDIKERMNIMFGLDLNRIPEIKDVKFNNPATIVFWADGTKTVVKRQKGDRFDKEKGLAMAIVKKLYGNKARYNDLFKKWIKEDK